MTQEQDEQALELRRIRRMMKQLYVLAEQASLTGAFPNGATEAADRYNQVLRRLDATGVLDAELFAPLTGEITWDRVAVASRLLEGYLIEDAPRDALGNVVINGIGNLGDIDKLKDLGRTIRESLPEFLRNRTPEPPVPPTPPVPPVPPAAPAAAEQSEGYGA